jgi:hypothetical protein
LATDGREGPRTRPLKNGYIAAVWFMPFAVSVPSVSRNLPEHDSDTLHFRRTVRHQPGIHGLLLIAPLLSLDQRFAAACQS